MCGAAPPFVAGGELLRASDEIELTAAFLRDCSDKVRIGLNDEDFGAPGVLF
jgi:hypothetical protein